MTTPLKPNDNSENSIQDDVNAESSEVSEKLLEQLNHNLLKTVHEAIIHVKDVVVTQAPVQDATVKKEDGMRIDFSSIIKGLLLTLPLIAAIVMTANWVTSSIDSKVRESHQDLKQDMQTMKQELSDQNKDTQSSLMRLSDRSDAQFEKFSDKLDRIGQKMDSKN